MRLVEGDVDRLGSGDLVSLSDDVLLSRGYAFYDVFGKMFRWACPRDRPVMVVVSNDERSLMTVVVSSTHGIGVLSSHHLRRVT